MEEKLGNIAGIQKVMSLLLLLLLLFLCQVTFMWNYVL